MEFDSSSCGALANHFWAHRAQTCHCVGSKKQSNGSSMLVTCMANRLTNTWWKINHLVHIFCLIIPGVTAEIVLTGWCPSFPLSQPFSYNSIQINKDHNLVQLLKFCCQHLWFICSDMPFTIFSPCNNAMLANVDTSCKANNLVLLACQIIWLITTEMVLTIRFSSTAWSWQFPFYIRKRIQIMIRFSCWYSIGNTFDVS